MKDRCKNDHTDVVVCVRTPTGIGEIISGWCNDCNDYFSNILHKSRNDKS